MKKLTVFFNQQDAAMAKDFLQAHEIHSEVVGAREYASIVVGGSGTGRYELLVEDGHYDIAKQLLAPIQTKLRPVEMTNGHDDDISRPNYYRRAIFYALAAIPMLPPIISNYASLVNAHLYWRHSDQTSKDRMKLIFIYILQIPSFVSIWALYHNFISGRE